MLQTRRVLQDRYQLDRPLSQAAGRQTWLAIDLQTQAWVVVKLLAFSDVVQWDRVRLFEREAAILKQLQHPRIPRYRDQFCLDDRLLWFGLVQDYIPGRSLQDRLAAQGAVSETEAQAIGLSVLEILSYLHRLNPPVLHRDLKPSNLIWGEDDEIYLVDFGAVQDRIAAEGATFTVVGTYGYVPLEQLGGRAVPASDLYALGATLIHLVMGISPADLPQQNGRLQLNSADLSPAFRRWLLHMTEPNLDRRFVTAAQALKQLQSVQAAAQKTQYPEEAILRLQRRSRISLSKTPQHLILKLPASRLRLALVALAPVLTVAFFISLVTHAAGAVVFVFLPSLLPLVYLLSYALPGTIAVEAVFDAQQFEIRWKLLGICLHRVRGETAALDSVFATRIRGYSGSYPALGLGAGVGEYRLGTQDPPLSEAECTWLAAELAAWLGFSGRSDHAAG